MLHRNPQPHPSRRPPQFQHSSPRHHQQQQVARTAGPQRANPQQKVHEAHIAQQQAKAAKKAELEAHLRVQRKAFEAQQAIQRQAFEAHQAIQRQGVPRYEMPQQGMISRHMVQRPVNHR